MGTEAFEGGAPLLTVEGLRVSFPGRAGRGHAVDGVSVCVRRGQTVGLVGESGSGKTTVARAALRLLDHTGARVEGRVLFDGVDVLRAGARALKGVRARAQIVFQDPGSSLSPRMRVGDIVAEPLVVHRPAWCAGGRAASARAEELLERVGLGAGSARRFPHEFSGGQKQRIAIARALALKPDLIVCDEPTSALDVTVQAGVLNLLADLQRERGLAFLFVSHDLAVVRHVCEASPTPGRIAVMRGGRVVEEGPAPAVIESAREEYTRGLIEAAMTG